MRATPRARSRSPSARDCAVRRRTSRRDWPAETASGRTARRYPCAVRARSLLAGAACAAACAVAPVSTQAAQLYSLGDAEFGQLGRPGTHLIEAFPEPPLPGVNAAAEVVALGSGSGSVTHFAAGSA